VVGRSETIRARSLAPLEKARGFGMTSFKTRARLATILVTLGDTSRTYDGWMPGGLDLSLRWG